MDNSPKIDEKKVQEQPANTKREPYQTPDIIYEGVISIRAGSPISFTVPGDPFGSEGG